MRWFRLGRRVRLVLVATAAVACAVGGAAFPAQAGLSGTDWSAAALPPDFVLGAGTSNVVSPVSCAPGTGFCVAVVNDSALINPVTLTMEPADVVTTDGGQSWTGYTDMTDGATSLSCVTTQVCWGVSWGLYYPQVSETTDGGQTWTLLPVAALADGNTSWQPSAIDCVSVTTCWVSGKTGPPVAPMMAETTDGGATWTIFSNLPAITPYDPNGTYSLSGLSCVSALSCVAVGGLNESDGLAQVIWTTDGGATWSLSAAPALSGLENLFSVSCVPVPGGAPVCYAAGDALQSAGPVVLVSDDGGATWTGEETNTPGQWLNSITCPDSAHCWAAGAGTTLALLGTGDSGADWQQVTSDTTNEVGEVSCATDAFCVAATDNQLWVTTDGGGLPAASTGLAAQPGPAGGAASPPVRTLPAVSPAVLPTQAGHPVTVTGQYRGTTSRATVQVTIKPPSGTQVSETVKAGLNHYYSVRIAKLARGTTTVTFRPAGANTHVVTVHGYPGPAPRVTGLSAHAGPQAGGNQITITGDNFTGASRVVFRAPRRNRDAPSFRVVSSTKITATVPPGSGASYVSVVTTRGGPSTQVRPGVVYNYLPVPAISGLSPAAGSAGTRVTVTGAGLAFIRSIWFGTTRATGLEPISATKIQVTAPPGTGTVPVKIITAGGAATSASDFTY